MRIKHILAGRLIDGSGSPVQKGICLVIEDGRIAELHPVDHDAEAGEGETIDLRHCTLLPPLVDCSLSLGISAATGETHESTDKAREYDDIKKVIARHLRYCFSHGVLAVADGSDEHGFISRFKRTEVADEGVSIHAGVWLPRPLDLEGERAVGPADDFVRIACSVDMDEYQAGESPLFAAGINTLLEKVDRKKRVMVANGYQAVARALEAGCGAIEQGVFMGVSNLLRMAKEEVCWIPCLLKLKNLADGALPQSASLYKKAFREQLGLLRQAREIGVKVASGTAAGFPSIIHGESMREEMKLLLAAGYPLTEALRCASINGAELFGIDDIGVLKKGGPATFLVTRGTVQQLPRKLGYLEDIYIAGNSSDMYRKNPVKTVHSTK